MPPMFPLTIQVTNMHPLNLPFLMKRTAGLSIMTLSLCRLPADRPHIPDSLVAGTGHIAETFRRHLRVVTPVDIRM